MGILKNQLSYEGGLLDLFIPNYVYKDLTLSDKEIVCYLAIYSLCKGKFTNENYISTECVELQIYGTRTNKSIGDSLDLLIFKGIIDGEKLTDTIYKISGDSFDSNDYFAILPYDSFISLMHSNYKNKDQLLRYYCWLLGSRTNKVGNQKISYFAKVMECSERTIIRYNQILEDMKLIYIKRVTLKNQHGANIYGLLSDKALVDKFKHV